MHHVLLDRWSQGASPIHRRDARAKIVALLVFLVMLATTPADAVPVLVTYAALLASAILIAGLPLGSVLLRAMVVLPFSLTFALISCLAGEPLRALALVEKSYLSTVGVLLLAGTTSLPLLLGGLERLGTPRLLVLVAQFLYRYLFVLSEQAQHMRLAASCREGGVKARRKFRFRAATGALAMLFARSYNRAEGIHRAMQARGFSGRFSLLHPQRFGALDAAFLLFVSVFLVVVRVA
ncbi:MAG: energy-coupling factor transporter transmembrane component T [Bryobacteraceae bacterium]